MLRCCFTQAKMNVAFLVVAVAVTLLSTSVLSTKGDFTLYTCNNDTDCASVLTGSACYKTSGCQKGVCKCINGRQNSTNQCVTPTVMLQGACTQDSDCINPTASCVAGVCSCNDGAPSGGNTVCTRIALGSACSASTRGCGVFASCMGNTTTQCQCLQGYKATADGINCSPYAQNDACDATSQCGYPLPSVSAYCDATGHCACNATYSRWFDSLNMNVNIGKCIPPTAQTGVAVGQACTPIEKFFTANPPIQICGDNLVCAACPEDPNTPKCQGTTYSSTTAAPSNTTTVAGNSGALPSHVLSWLSSVITLVVAVVMAVIV